MTDFLTYLGSWSALQWVLLVLAAGFIGQFGRMMADAIIARIRRNRAGQGSRVQEPRSREESTAPSSGVSPQEPPLTVAGNVPDKKALKIAAKARKKEAKERE